MATAPTSTSVARSFLSSPTASSEPGWVVWARVLGAGSIQRDFGHHVATNARGELLVAARLEPLDDGSELGDWREGPASEDDATVDLSAGELRKLGPDGTTVWRIPLRATRMLRAPEVALDGSGCAYVAGPYAPVKGTLRGAHHVTLTKLGPQGDVEWTRPLAKVQVVRGALDAPIARVAADPAGGACVTWIREGERFPALRVCHCTGEGSVAWDHAWLVTGGTAHDPHVGLDAGGAAVVWGSFRGQIDFDSELSLSSLPEAHYVARVQADGYVRWAKTLRIPPGLPHATAIAEDGTLGRACLVPASAPKSPDAPPLLALLRMAASGEPLPSVQGRLGKHAGVSSLHLAPIGAGAFALAGYFSGALTFGGTDLQSLAPASEALFVAYAPREGDFVARVFQGPQLQGGLSVHGGAEGSILVCGWLCGSMVLGTQTIESPSDRAVLFAAKLCPR